MPDLFVPYPSPAPSGGSPAPTQAVDPARPGAADYPTWAFDPFFDAMYDQPEMTDEEITLLLESIVDIPPTEPLFDVVPQDPGGSGQMNLPPTSKNAQVVPPSSFGSNEPALHSTHSQPRQHPNLLPPLALNSTFTPPSPPYTIRPDQLYQPRAYQQQPPVFHPPARQMNHAYRREPERMALPGPGDLDVSMCEIIM
ncbi:hypothetical protein FRC10_006737 [Ceratobasidium sp. 414]|nr:hypothetical protein FRC10_006737 [Ceratobasidium sp. 414]